MNYEHKPCPFCMSERVLIVEGSNFRWERVQCIDCGACGPETQQINASSVWELWDNRAGDSR